jgi:hypothetical protein
MPRLGDRKEKRINFQKPGFVILEPDGAWIECAINDISSTGVCLDVGALVIGFHSRVKSERVGPPCLPSDVAPGCIGRRPLRYC